MTLQVFADLHPRDVVESDMENVRVRHFQSLLQARRQELLSRLNHVKEESRPNEHDYGRDEGDRAKSLEAKELLSRLNGQERLMLDTIERALRRVDDGTFGVCARCQKEIGATRLEAVPWALRCIHCQQRIEGRIA